MEEVNFELGSQESMNVPSRIIIGFQQRDRQDSRNLYNGSFCRLPVTSCQCIIGTEKYPDVGTVLNMILIIIVKVIVQLEKLLEL